MVIPYGTDHTCPHGLPWDECGDPQCWVPDDDPPPHDQDAAEPGQHAPLTAEQRYALMVQDEIRRQRVRRDAARALAAEERPPARRPEVLTLRERLARPRQPLRYRIDGWQPIGSRIVLAAQYKAGKTTARDNLVRSLVDGDPWLGRFKVEPIDGTVVILDLEMSPDQGDDWLAAQRIANDDRIVPIWLRGNGAALDLLDRDRRTEWATELRRLGCTYLVLDCLRPVLDALGLDEHTEAGRFLVAFDALLAEAGITEANVVHHMGHTGERSRGDSRIRDWPDVEWRLVRQDDDPSSPRYISAYGRDVDQPEARLSYDPATRHLTYVGGTRANADNAAALTWVLTRLAERPGTSRWALGEQAGKDGAPSRRAILAAINQGILDGFIDEMDNPYGRGKLLCLSTDIGLPHPPADPRQTPADGSTAALYRAVDPADLPNTPRAGRAGGVSVG